MFGITPRGGAIAGISKSMIVRVEEFQSLEIMKKNKGMFDEGMPPPGYFFFNRCPGAKTQWKIGTPKFIFAATIITYAVEYVQVASRQ